jgi:hypothetical protein
VSVEGEVMKRFVRNIRDFLIGLGLAGVAAGCGPSIHQFADYEHTVSFDGYRTFHIGDFDPEPPGGLESRGEPPAAILDALNGAITEELTAKGLTAADEASADLLINVNAGGQTRSRTIPPAAGATNPFQGSYVERYREGTLIIDIRDRENNMLIWHGWATAAVDEGGASVDLVVEAVHKILALYPPE